MRSLDRWGELDVRYYCVAPICRIDFTCNPTGEFFVLSNLTK
jgi:hypothetical protein